MGSLLLPFLHRFCADPARAETALPNWPSTSSGLLLLRGAPSTERAALQFLLPMHNRWIAIGMGRGETGISSI